MDGLARTIRLPENKCNKLIEELKNMENAKEITVKALQSIQGKLQFASVGIPLGKPLLAAIDQKIARAEARGWPKIKINPHSDKDELVVYSKNWIALLHLMKSRPSHVNELIKHPEASYQGLVDAFGWGVGGVWFRGEKELAPFVWFYEWPEEVRNKLCTDTNKEGTITISDLELLGIFMHWLALEAAVGAENLRHTSPAIWCDNLPAVSWVYKLRSNVSILAANILRALATRLHHCESGLVAIDHISGIHNIMADVASRKHDVNLLKFLSFFHKTFPPPQNNSWLMFQHSTKVLSRICSQLLLKTSKMGSWR